MASDVDVTVAGRDVPAGGGVDVIAEYGKPLILDVSVRSQTDREIVDLRVLSNLPDGAWTADGPDAIPPHGEARIVLSVDAAALYDAPATLKRIAVDLEYRLVRRFN